MPHDDDLLSLESALARQAALAHELLEDLQANTDAIPEDRRLYLMMRCAWVAASTGMLLAQVMRLHTARRPWWRRLAWWILRR